MASITELFKEQEKTTEEVKQLRMVFEEYFDSQKQNKLGLLESMREKKKEQSGFFFSGSKSKASNTSDNNPFKSILDSALSSLTGKLITGALTTAIVAAIASGLKVAFQDFKNDLMKTMGLDDAPGAPGDNPMLDPAVQLSVFGKSFGNLGGKGFARLQPVGRPSISESLKQYTAKNTTPDKIKSFTERVNGKVVAQAGDVIPGKSPSMSQKGVFVAKEVVERVAPKILAKSTPYLGTGVGAYEAARLLSEGKIGSAAITLLGNLPGMSTLTNLSAGSVVILRETYKGMYGSYPSEEAAQEIKETGGLPIQTAEKLRNAGIAVLDALKPKRVEGGVGFTESLTKASAGATKFDANRAAKIQQYDNYVNQINPMTGKPNQATSLQPIINNTNITTGSGGRSGASQALMNPPSMPTGSLFDSQNSALNASAL